MKAMTLHSNICRHNLISKQFLLQMDDLIYYYHVYYSSE